LPTERAISNPVFAYWRAELDSETRSIAQSIAETRGSGRDALGKSYWHKQHRARVMVRTYEALLQWQGDCVPMTLAHDYHRLFSA
jgi:hypothetical protein